MANKKITELTELTSPAGADLFAIVDDTDTTTKKVTVSNLMTQAPVQAADISGLATQVSLGNHEALTSSVHGISAFGATLVDDANASAARTTLGLGTAATSASTDFSPAFFTTVSDTTTARTLGDSDNGKVIVFSNSSAITVSVPDSLTSGFGCTIVQGGNGKVTVVASGTASVNAYNAGSGALNTTAGQYAALQLIPTGSDAYTLSGDGGLPPFLNTYSLSFDGTNDYLTPSTNISISGAKTVTFWVYPDSFNNRCVLAGGGGASYWFFWGSSTAAYIVSASYPVRSSGSNVSWTAGQWYHIGIVDDGAGTITPYINGNAQDTMSVSGKSFAIGTIGNLTAHYFDGLLDEIGFWNTALGASEISEIYGSSGNREFDLTANSGNYSSSSSLQHYYRMGDNDSGSSSTVTDNAGSKNLTVNGATSSTTVPS